MAAEKKAHRTQLLAAVAVSLGSLAGGMGKGYTSPAIVSLQEHSPFKVSDQEASWVASLSLLGALLGGCTGGCMMKMGRQRVLMFVSLPFAMSWLLTAYADSVALLCATSLSAGYFTATTTMVAQVYISETTVASSRGRLSALSKVLNQAGVLLSFCLGALWSWRVHALIIACAPLVLFCAVVRLPETPSYLVLRRNEVGAATSLRWLRGPSADVDLELDAIRSNVLAVDERGRYRAMAKPLLVTCGLMLFQRFTGAYALNFYAVSVLKASLGATSPHVGAIAMAVVHALSSCLSALLVDSVGRLPLLKASGLAMSVALAGFGSYHYCSLRPDYDWIPMLCVLAFTIAFALGIGPISWLLVGELFPLECRGAGSSLATTFSYLCAFVNVKTFVDFQHALGLHGTFWLYALVALSGVVFVTICVPETRGKNMDEMQYNQNVI